MIDELRKEETDFHFYQSEINNSSIEIELDWFIKQHQKDKDFALSCANTFWGYVKSYEKQVEQKKSELKKLEELIQRDQGIHKTWVRNIHEAEEKLQKAKLFSEKIKEAIK